MRIKFGLVGFCPGLWCSAIGAVLAPALITTHRERTSASCLELVIPFVASTEHRAPKPCFCLGLCLEQISRTLCDASLNPECTKTMS